jgi:hypothetical protein
MQIDAIRDLESCCCVVVSLLHERNSIRPVHPASKAVLQARELVQDSRLQVALVDLLRKALVPERLAGLGRD